MDEFLKDLYFHELSARERIVSRLQLYFGFQASIVAAAAYMTRMLDYSCNWWVVLMFWICILASAAPLSGSIYFAIRALTGHTYATFPLAKEAIGHRARLIQYRLDHLSSEAAAPKSGFPGVDAFAIQAIAECIDFNHNVNESRNRIIRRTFANICYAGGLLSLSAFVFVIFDLDTSSPRKNHLVEDVNIKRSLDALTELIDKIQTEQRSSNR